MVLTLTSCLTYFPFQVDEFLLLIDPKNNNKMLHSLCINNNDATSTYSSFNTAPVLHVSFLVLSARSCIVVAGNLSLFLKPYIWLSAQIPVLLEAWRPTE